MTIALNLENNKYTFNSLNVRSQGAEVDKSAKLCCSHVPSILLPKFEMLRGGLRWQNEPNNLTHTGQNVVHSSVFLIASIPMANHN